MNEATVVYDSCVLYPAPLRSFLLYLAVTGLYRARWTDRIHEEWMRHVLADYPDISQPKIERVRDLMNAHVADCLVVGYEPLIPTLSLPDPDDRHVLAAAIHAGAGVIVTSNLKDFPESTLSPFGVSAQHPDEFIANLIATSPEVVCGAARAQRQSLKKPPMTAAEFLESLRRQGVAKSVALLERFADSI